MSKREKKKKIITGIMSSATLIGGATAGIIYAGKTEEKKEAETEEEKKTKTQSTTTKPSNSNIKSKQKIHKPQSTTYFDESNNKKITNKTDLSDENIKEVIKIGFYQNGEGEIQAIKMPKIIEKVPNQLPPEITSTKDMFAGALSFQQNLSRWNVANVIKYQDFATDAKINNTTINYLPLFNKS